MHLANNSIKLRELQIKISKMTKKDLIETVAQKARLSKKAAKQAAKAKTEKAEANEHQHQDHKNHDHKAGDTH